MKFLVQNSTTGIRCLFEAFAQSSDRLTLVQNETFSKINGPAGAFFTSGIPENQTDKRLGFTYFINTGNIVTTGPHNMLDLASDKMKHLERYWARLAWAHGRAGRGDDEGRGAGEGEGEPADQTLAGTERVFDLLTLPMRSAYESEAYDVGSITTNTIPFDGAASNTDLHETVLELATFGSKKLADFPYHAGRFREFLMDEFGCDLEWQDGAAASSNSL